MFRITGMILVFLMGLVSWGVGGCGGSKKSVTSEEEFDAGDFTGLFSYKDDNCVGGSSVQEFGADDEMNRIFITDPGSTAFSEGDSFTFEEGFENGFRVAVADDLGCGCRYVLNAADADDIESRLSIDAATGDLLCVCFDLSADGLCEETFARTSTEF